MTDTVLLERDNSLAIITLNRPKAFNALDEPTKIALLNALRDIADDDAIRAIVITGAGTKAFCVGQDLREHVTNLTSDDPLATVRDHYNPIAELLYGLKKPVVAAVRGAAAGAGASLSFLADFRIGGPATTFTMAFSGIGLAADTGASYTLPRLVGHAKATEMLLLNKTVRADEAANCGLLTELRADDDEVLPSALELGHQLASGPTVSYGRIKQQLRLDTDFSGALADEAEAQATCGFTQDHTDATHAFVNKQKPVFQGR